MTFKIGMKVVCVDADGMDLSQGEIGPKLGGIYTIRSLPSIEGSTAIQLEEIINRVGVYRTGVFECGFRPHRFRPAVSPKQQVSFTTGAPLDSEQWDNRRKRVEVVS